LTVLLLQPLNVVTLFVNLEKAPLAAQLIAVPIFSLILAEMADVKQVKLPAHVLLTVLLLQPLNVVTLFVNLEKAPLAAQLIAVPIFSLILVEMADVKQVKLPPHALLTVLLLQLLNVVTLFVILEKPSVTAQMIVVLPISLILVEMANVKQVKLLHLALLIVKLPLLLNVETQFVNLERPSITVQLIAKLLIRLPPVVTESAKLENPLLAQVTVILFPVVLLVVALVDQVALVQLVETQFVNLVNLSTVAQVIALPVLFVVMECAKWVKP